MCEFSLQSALACFRRRLEGAGARRIRAMAGHSPCPAPRDEAGEVACGREEARLVAEDADAPGDVRDQPVPICVIVVYSHTSNNKDYCTDRYE